MRKLSLFLLLVVLSFIRCSEPQKKITPIREDIRESVYASGIIKSDHQYQVYATINGLIQDVKVTKGDTITAGDPLFVIRNEVTRLNTENAKLAAELADYDANINKLNELKINIDLARTRMMNDSMLFARQKKLWDNQIGTQVEMEQRELAYENSRTNYNSAILRYDDLKRQLEFASDQAKKSLKISQSQEDDLTIRSLIDGRVYAIFSEQGEMVSPQTPLAIVGDASSFLLELYVDEYDVVKVQPGQKVLVTLDSYKGQVFEAVVTRVYPYMDARSKTFTTEAVFTEAPGVLFPNLTLESNIIINSKENVLTIPRSFLLPDGYVMLKSGNKVKVTTGLMDFNKVEILDGLSETDELRKPAE